MRRNRDRRAWMLMGLAIALMLPLTGCGAGSKNSASGAPASSSRVVDDAKAYVARLEKPPGSHRRPQPSSAKPTPGKTVWFISVGNEAESAAVGARAFVQGATVLGWKAKVFDGKFSPNLWLAGIRQAVQLKADAIALFGFDCAPVKAGLQEAKAAGIPVIAMDGFDCNRNDPSAPALFTQTVGYADGPFADWQRAWGLAQANYTIAKTNGKAKILFLRETDLLATRVLADEYAAKIATCRGCSIVKRIDFVGTDFGPSLQSKVQQALAQHPETTVVYANYDGPVTGGVDAAVRASGSHVMVIGGDGLRPNLALIREGRQAMAVDYVSGWEEYAALDSMVAIFAGKRPPASSGMGVLLIDKDHNLPANGVPQAPIDWKSVYEQAWRAR